MTDPQLPAGEASPPRNVVYHERLRPSPWLWAAALGAGLFLGVAYGSALGPLAGLLTTAIIAGTGFWLVARLSTQVIVDDLYLHAGRARLPRQFVGRVRALDPESTAVARGPGGDANAFLLLRTGYSKSSVAVEVTDPRDPHSYWLISSRHPEALASAMMASDPPQR